MNRATQRTLEITCMTTLVLLTLLAYCWGPALPPDPATPIVNPFMCGATIAIMAGYGFWKMRK